MDYERSIPLHGSPARALETVRDYLISHNFQIIEVTPSTVKALSLSPDGTCKRGLSGMFAEVTASMNGDTMTIQARRGQNLFLRLIMGGLILSAALLIISFLLFLMSGRFHQPGPYVTYFLSVPTLGVLFTLTHKLPVYTLNALTEKVAKMGESNPQTTWK